VDGASSAGRRAAVDDGLSRNPGPAGTSDLADRLQRHREQTGEQQSDARPSGQPPHSSPADAARGSSAIKSRSRAGTRFIAKVIPRAGEKQGACGFAARPIGIVVATYQVGWGVGSVEDMRWGITNFMPG